MRILKLKGGEEMEVSDQLFQKIEPYLQSGKNGKFKVRGQEYKIWDIQDYSDVVDDAFMTVIERQTQYVEETNAKIKAKTLFEHGRKITPEEWKEKQLAKLDRFNEPPLVSRYPDVYFKNSSKVGMGDDKVYRVAMYDRMIELYRTIPTEVRSKIIEKAKELIDNYPMERNAAGRAYLAACKLHFLPTSNAKRNQIFGI